MSETNKVIDSENYCRDYKRSIYGEYKDCDINIEAGGKYNRGNYECHCKIKDK